MKMNTETQTPKTEADEYFVKFFEEKENIEDFCLCEVKENDIWDFNFTTEDMVNILMSFDESTKQKIRDTLVKIDFANGDVNDFLNYVFTGYCKVQMGESLAS